MRRKLLSILALLCLTASSAWANYGWYDGSMTIGGKTTDPTAWSTDSGNPTDLGCVSDMTISSIAFKVWSDANDRVGANMYFRILDGSSQVGSDQDVWLGASTRITGDYDFSISRTGAEDLAAAVGLTLETGKTYYIDMWAKTYGYAGDEWYSGDYGSNYHAKLTIAHALVAHPAVAATCTTAGNSAYWSCSACGKYFSDENGENEISADSWEIPATGHTIVNNICSGCGKYGYCGTTSNESDVTWELTGTSPDYTLTISGTGAMKDYDMPWDGYKGEIQSVVINSGVTTIGDAAFYECSSLASVSIPSSVTSIGSYAFYECTSLASVSIPSSVTYIGDGAFYKCIALTSVTIPATVTYIGSYAFNECIALTSVTIPANVTTIETGAFCDCASLTAITLPDGVTTIGESAFSRTGLTTITIPAGVTQIGSYAFSDCSDLASVTFEGDSQLEDIGASAFWGTALTSFEIGSKVTSIGEGAFSDCKNLTTITVDENKTAFKVVNGVLFSKDGTTLHTYPKGLTDDSYEIPDGVTTICGYAFYYCSYLEDIKNLKTVTSIGEYALDGTAWIAKQPLVDGVIYANNIAIAYDYDASRTELTIKDGTTKIAPNCFNGCGKLTAVTIPASLTTLGDYAFCWCRNLASVTFKDVSQLESVGKNAFCGTSLASVTIPANVTTIGKSAFEDCTSLATVTFETGSKLKTIGDCAFNECRALPSVTIPASVTYIGDNAFTECADLASVTFVGVSQLETIGASAFWGTALTSVTIPANVTSIGVCAFYECDNLATVTLNSNPYIEVEAIPAGAAVTMNLTANAAGGAKWMTFCSSYGNFKADDDTQVFQAELNDATGALTLREIDDKIVNMGEGVILKSTGNPVMTLTDDDSSDEYLYNNLIGVTDPAGRENTDNGLYVLNYKAATGVGFYKLADGKTVGYGKACLWYDSSTTARAFFGFDETTGMSDVRSKMADVRGDFFDLQGRKVVNPTKGLYIVNGKKVIIK